MEFRYSSDFRSKHMRGYSTYAACNPLLSHAEKADLEHLFSENNIFHKIENMENPLQKNLGDSHNSEIINDNLLNKKMLEKIETETTDIEIPNSHKSSEGSWLTGDIFLGVTNIITGLFKHITSSIVHPATPININSERPSFNKESLPTSEKDQKDSGFEEWSCDETDASPPISDDIRHFVTLYRAKNNTEASEKQTGSDIAQCGASGERAGAAHDIAMPPPPPLPTISDPADTCLAKMAKIKELLAGKSSAIRNKTAGRYRPRKVFIDPKFVQETAVDTFVPEQTGRLQSTDTTDFVNLGVITPSHLAPAELQPRVRLERDQLKPTTETDTETSPASNHNQNHEIDDINSRLCSSLNVTNDTTSDLTQETDSEKTLLNNSISNTESKLNDILVYQSCKSCNHVDPLEQHRQSSSVDIGESVQTESAGNSPGAGTGFDELNGRLECAAPDDDPFSVVVCDVLPRPPRERIPSDASDDSFDSFIVFEEDPEISRAECFVLEDSCESDADSDKDCNLDRMGRFSYTQIDLTDESLYQETNSKCEVRDGPRTRPLKKVRFSPAPPQVRVMRVWDYASRQARLSNWRQQAADAERFKRRIADVEMAISWVLKPQHRNRVKFQRFMPWWHQQRRAEEAERRAAQEEERRAALLREEEEHRAALLREEEERLRLEEERRIEEETEQPEHGAVSTQELTNTSSTTHAHADMRHTDTP